MTDADFPPNDRSRDDRPHHDDRRPDDRADGTTDGSPDGAPADHGHAGDDAPTVDFGSAPLAAAPHDGSREPAAAPAVDFGGAESTPTVDVEQTDGDAHDRGHDGHDGQGPEVDAGHHRDGQGSGELFPPAASLPDDVATPMSPDGTTPAAAEVPAGGAGQRVDGPVDDSGTAHTVVAGEGSAQRDETTTPDSATADSTETRAFDAPGADQHDESASDRDGTAHAAERTDSVPPPVVAPVAPAARAWSATPTDGRDEDGPRRPLHDDEALRAAEAARTEPVTRHDDRDAPTVAAPLAPGQAPGAGSGLAAGAAAGAGAAAAGSGHREDDGRLRDARTTAYPVSDGGSGMPSPTGERDRTGGYPTTDDGDIDRVGLRRDLLAEQKEEFGGMRFGSGLLGWFTATGVGVVLFAIFASITAGVAVASTTDPTPFTMQAYLQQNGDALSLVVGVAVLVIVFVGYLLGGYTASRMARFSGVKQGIATWLWGLVITVVTTVVAGVVAVQAGDQSAPNPMIPTTDDLLSSSVESIVFLALLVVLSFVGAVLGGLLGQRYHRRVDRFIPEHQV